jgi:hypothetical protein
MLPVVAEAYGARIATIRFPADNIEEVMPGLPPFDCFLVNREPTPSREGMRRILDCLVRSPTGWIETFGYHAQAIHDGIDQTSVAVGRQVSVGDGNPMTAWHARLVTDREIADYIRTGGQGTCELKAVLIVGCEAAEKALLRELVQALAEGNRWCDAGNR